MEHPAMAAGGGVGGPPQPGAFQRCRHDRRCGVCRLLQSQGRRERALFRTILSRDNEFLLELERLAELFYDAAVTR